MDEKRSYNMLQDINEKVQQLEYAFTELTMPNGSENIIEAMDDLLDYIYAMKVEFIVTDNIIMIKKILKDLVSNLQSNKFTVNNSVEKLKLSIEKLKSIEEIYKDE